MANKDLTIEQGKTFSQVLRWEAPPILYKPITGIEAKAPVKIACVGHNIPPGWRVAVVSVKGMTQINAPTTPPKDKDYRPATVVDTDHIELNDINAADFKPYLSGGYVQLNSPVDLTGYSALLQVKDKVGGTTLLTFTSDVPGLTDGVITLDNVGKSITLSLAATISASLAWTKGIYELELTSSTGVVTALLTGSFSVTKEVTTT